MPRVMSGGQYEKKYHGHELKSEVYIQASNLGYFTRFENSETQSSAPECFTSTRKT